VRAVTSVRRRGPSLGSLVLLAAVLVFALVAVAAVVYALWALGKIDLPFLTRAAPPPPQGPPPGKVAVFVSAKAIPAYTKLTRDHIWDAKRNDFAVQWVTPEAVRERGFVTDFNKLFGRVLDHDKPAGYAFTEKDFLPEGTRPGVVAGIPEGKRAFLLDVAKVEGIHALKAGDHFDLVGSFMIDGKVQVSGHPYGGALPGSVSASGNVKHATVKVLVQDGIVVTPVAVRTHAVDPTKPPPKTPPKEKPVEEMTIAIDPSEVAPLSEALALKAEIMCVARSGRPDDDKETRLPNPEEPKVWVMESIKGKSHERLVFPMPAKPAGGSASESVGRDTAKK
jgi:Flp pilus assembly protein CpaB